MRTPTCRSRTSTTSAAGATRCCSTSAVAGRALCSRRQPSSWPRSLLRTRLRSRLAFRASASTRSPAARRRASRPAGCATCSSRCGSCRTTRSRPPRSPPAPSRTSTCSSFPTESRRSRPTRSDPRAARRCRPGSMAGATYIAWRGGVDLAARLGLTTARIAEPHSDVAGTLIRVAVDPASPLAAGVGEFNWVFYDYDIVMTASSPAHVAARFPAYGGPDFFVSGFARGESELGGTAAVIDEPVGTGRIVSFSTDPNYRAWTVGMQKMLRNAVLGDAAVRCRRRAARRLTDPRGRRARIQGRGRKGRGARVAAATQRQPTKRRRRARRPRPPRRQLHAAPLGKQSNVSDRQPHRPDRRRSSVRSDAARRTTRRRRSRHRISSAVAKPARARPGCRLLGIASASPVDHETIGMDDARELRAAARTPAFVRGKRERRGAPAVGRGSELEPGAGRHHRCTRARTAARISSGSMPCR